MNGIRAIHQGKHVASPGLASPILFNLEKTYAA